MHQDHNLRPQSRGQHLERNSMTESHERLWRSVTRLTRAVSVNQ